jgi:hypothetical protein
MRYELTDYEWNVIDPLLPNKSLGVPCVNGRRVRDGIFLVLVSSIAGQTEALPQARSNRFHSKSLVLDFRKRGDETKKLKSTRHHAGNTSPQSHLLSLAPPEMQAWLDMSINVIGKTGFPGGLDVDGLMRAFTVHNDAVKAAIPAKQLLLYQVKDGWEPLCTFLDVPVPSEPFPRTNDRIEFWDRVSGKK